MSETASMFNMRLPNGVRLGEASEDDLEAAILDYAEASDNRGRLVRDLLEILRRFERGGYAG